MDEEQQLLFQEGLLVQELELVRNKLKFVRLLKSEKQKDNDIPCPAMDKIPSIPECPASGKESSNPVMAMNLPKVQNEVQTSATLVKPSDFNLRPNGGIQIPKTDVTSASEKSDQETHFPNTFFKPYYVVFNGPNPGIYESWEITKKATEGVPGIKHKKFKTFLEARIVSDEYRRKQLLPPLELICSADTLRPNSYAKAVEKKKNKLHSLGKLPSKEPVTLQNKNPEDLTVAGFDYWYTLARTMSEDESILEHYFTTDNKNLSYFNFIINSNPEMVFEAFQYGLVKTIYPSNNLQEIKNFPVEVRKAIKQYRTKCIKGEKEIFLKVTSSIPAWENGILTRNTKHLIEIGICGGVKYAPGKKMDCSLEEKDLPELFIRKLQSFIQKSFNFHQEDKVFINFVNKDYFIYSKGFKPIKEEDVKKILFFQENIIADSRKAHDKVICQTLIKKAPHLYNCYECEKKDKNSTIRVEKTSSEDPPTKEKAVVEVLFKETCKNEDSSATSTSTSS